MTDTEGEGASFAWIHCGKCLKQFEKHNKIELKPTGSIFISKSEIKFIVLGCGHVLCQNCVQPIKSNIKSEIPSAIRVECSVCKETCFGYGLVGNLQSQLQEYIQPLGLQLEKIASSFYFQESHWESLVNALFKKVERQREVIKQAREELENAYELKKRYIELKAKYQEIIDKKAPAEKLPRTPESETPFLKKRQINFDSPIINPKRFGMRKKESLFKEEFSVDKSGSDKPYFKGPFSYNSKRR